MTYETRSKEDIMADIIELLILSRSNGMLPTPIMSKANMSYAQCKDYLNNLIELEFIALHMPANLSGKKSYFFTEKGFRWYMKHKIAKAYVNINKEVI